jgi:hypothetical protein
MSRPIDLARHFLALADRDIRALRKLVDDPEIDEATVGFLAQQAIEKSLKATLALYNRAFRRTHDLVELLDILADAQGSLPPHADSLDELNPYAVEFRYGFVEPAGLDRGAVKIMGRSRTGLGRATGGGQRTAAMKGQDKG